MGASLRVFVRNYVKKERLAPLVAVLPMSTEPASWANSFSFPGAQIFSFVGALASGDSYSTGSSAAPKFMSIHQHRTVGASS
jgi:hypothetical protein